MLLRVCYGAAAVALTSSGRRHRCNKAFNAVKPHRAYLNSDAQQCAVIKRMVRDLDMGIVVEMPIVREPDGLAMSSRNAYLSPKTEKRPVSVAGIV